MGDDVDGADSGPIEMVRLSLIRGRRARFVFCWQYFFFIDRIFGRFSVPKEKLQNQVQRDASKRSGSWKRPSEKQGENCFCCD